MRRRAFDPADHADLVDFYVDTEVSGSKEDFLKAVLNERKWEFAGENLRWKDLVRNNMYGEKLFFTFLDYYTLAECHGGGATYKELVNKYDFDDAKDLETICPAEIISAYVENYSDNNPNFPNESLYMFYVMNPYGESTASSSTKPAQWFTNEGLDDIYKVVSADYITGTATTFKPTDLQWVKTTMNWANDDGTLKNQVYYSFYGYVRGDEFNNIKVVNNGTATNFSVNPDNTQAAIDDNISRLPAVRYLLPYPQEAIARSAGVYKNYYGY